MKTNEPQGHEPHGSDAQTDRPLYSGPSEDDDDHGYTTFFETKQRAKYAEQWLAVDHTIPLREVR